MRGRVDGDVATDIQRGGEGCMGFSLGVLASATSAGRLQTLHAEFELSGRVHYY